MIKVGTSGFSFKDWVGPVYPQGMKPEEALVYYQEQCGMDCVEINSTYYALVSDKTFSGMERKTKDGFEFTVKAFRGITHDPFDPRLGDKRPTLDAAKDNLSKFLYSLGPLRDKNKLGAVLLQFPVFFEPSPASNDYLLSCKEQLGDVPYVVEFRSRGWAMAATYEFLRAHEIGFCAVDEPKLPRLMPMAPEVTAPTAYVRLHGRNVNWFSATTDERYNYLYSAAELQGIAPLLKKMAGASKKLYVFFNNCHTGSAMKNALMIKEMLNGAS